MLAAGPEVAEIATTAGTKRGELLGTATPKPWVDGATLLRRTGCALWRPDRSGPASRVRFAVRA